MKKKLMKLAASGGVSGEEFSISESVKKLMKPYCSQVEVDLMGNVTGTVPAKNPDAPCVMLEAHIDGIGLMVSSVDDEGFLSFIPVGGVDNAILPGAEVTVMGREPLFGVINTVPTEYLLSGHDEAEPISNLVIDIGLSAEAAREKVRVGDVVYFGEKIEKLSSKVLSGKSFDDRAGLISLLICLENLKGKDLPFTLLITATVQEEVGLRGAKVAAQRLAPACAFSVDVCHGDTPDSGPDDAFKLGSGAVISMGPNFHPYLSSLAKMVAEEEKIPVGFDPEGRHDGTNANVIQVAAEGVPVLLLSIPLRYMHTTVETLNFDDVKAVGNLLSAMLLKLDLEVLRCTFQN